jgi:hypothetical protein
MKLFSSSLTLRENKLERLFLESLFSLRLYLQARGAQVFSLTHKYYTRLERTGRNKCSILYVSSVSDEEKNCHITFFIITNTAANKLERLFLASIFKFQVSLIFGGRKELGFGLAHKH